MAAITTISFAFHGFAIEEEMMLKAYFANADKWDPPWELINQYDKAQVIVSKAATEKDYSQLTQNLPSAEIVVYSANKPEEAIWHLVRQANGKPSIVEFSKLVLKISRTLKKVKPKLAAPIIQQASEISQTSSDITLPVEIIKTPELTNQTIQEESAQIEVDMAPLDMSNFFNQLDSLMETKPNEKRKRFNEKN